MLNFLTANISPDGLRDYKAEKAHVLKPYGIVAQLRLNLRAPLFICSEARLLRWAVLEILMYAVYTPVFPLRPPCPRGFSRQ